MRCIRQMPSEADDLHAGRRLCLLNHFICATGAGEGVGFGSEGESHSEDIAHCFPQRVVAFELRICVDVGVHFQVDVVERKEPGERVRYIDTFCDFFQHPFLYAHRPPGCFREDIHEPAFAFPEEDDDRRELRGRAFHLAVGADADLQAVAQLFFPYEDGTDLVLYGDPNPGAVWLLPVL